MVEGEMGAGGVRTDKEQPMFSFGLVCFSCFVLCLFLPCHVFHDLNSDLRIMVVRKWWF